MGVGCSVVELGGVRDGELGGAPGANAVRGVEVALEQLERTSDDDGVALGVRCETFSDRGATAARRVADDVDEVVGIFGLSAVPESQRLKDDERRRAADGDRSARALALERVTIEFDLRHARRRQALTRA